MIVSIYAALLAIMFILLAVRTIKTRMRYNLPSGDNGYRDLQQAIRSHAHFAEYVPFSLILLLLLELQNASPTLLHGLGIALIIGRLLHAYSMLVAETYDGHTFTGTVKYRQAGMMLTFCVLGISAIGLLVTIK